MTTPDIVEFVTDQQLLGLSLSPAQETLLRAIYAVPMSEEQLEIYRQCTGRHQPPGAPFTEATIIAGARSGKDSRIAAPTVVYEALFGGHERRLGKGEKGVIALVAQGRDATAIAFGYIKNYLTDSPLLADLVEENLNAEIRLTNGLVIKCFPSTLRAPRGRTIPVAVMDELGFYRLEGQADSDAEIQMSLKRGMGTFPGRKLIKISTPYLTSGVLYEDFKRAWGQADSPLLVWRAPTVLMHPALAEYVERQRGELDPEMFRREYEAEFIAGFASFLPRDLIDAAVIRNRRELPPAPRVPYYAAVDPSGGGEDAFTMAVAHTEGERVVLDVLRGWAKERGKRVDLDGIVREIADILARYRIGQIVGDRYGGDWPPQAFRTHGVKYHVSQWTRAEGYLALEPLLIQGRVEFLDHPNLVRELGLLERRHGAGGRVLVDHPSGHHDDYANAAALALWVAEHARRSQQARARLDDEDEVFGKESWRPSGITDDAELGPETEEGKAALQAKIARLKQRCLAAGHKAEVIASYEREYPDHYLISYLEELLERGTMKQRLRRAGLD